MGWNLSHWERFLKCEMVIHLPKINLNFGKVELFRGLEWKIYAKMAESFQIQFSISPLQQSKEKVFLKQTLSFLPQQLLLASTR